MHEQLLLRVLQFNLEVVLPYKFLLVYAKAIGGLSLLLSPPSSLPIRIALHLISPREGGPSRMEHCQR